MKQVLLAINGDIPTNATFNYAVGLCTRIRAQLNILQFVNKRPRCILSTKQKGEHLGILLDNAYIGDILDGDEASPPADGIASRASVPLKKMLTGPPITISYQVDVSNGNPETDLPQYIENHPDVVLTIFDPSKTRAGKCGQQLQNINQIKKTGIPLVVVNT